MSKLQASAECLPADANGRPPYCGDLPAFSIACRAGMSFMPRPRRMRPRGSAPARSCGLPGQAIDVRPPAQPASPPGTVHDDDAKHASSEAQPWAK